MTTVTQELVYNLDDKGARTTIAKDYTGTSVFCYELAMRKSTKQITGYMRCVSTTVQDSTITYKDASNTRFALQAKRHILLN